MKSGIWVKGLSSIIALAMLSTLLGACKGSEFSSPEKKIIEYNRKGLDLSNQGKYGEAIAVLLQAADMIYELHPEFEDLKEETQTKDFMGAPFANLSRAYYLIEEYEESLGYIEKALLLRPNASIEHIHHGNALYSMNRSREAMEAYDRALKQSRDAYSANYGKGLIYYDLGDYEQALEQFEIYLSYESDDEAAMEMLLDTLIEMSDYEEALSRAGAWEKEHPKSLAAARFKATALIYAEDLEKAETYITDVIKQYPDEVDLRLLLGKLYYTNGSYEQAIEAYEPYVDYVDGWIGLLRGYAAAGQYEQLDNMLSNGSISDAEEYAAVGDLYMEWSQYMDAANYYKEAARLEPVQEYAMSALRAMYAGNRIEQCVQYAASVKELSYGNNGIPWYAGLCYLDQRAYSDAIEQFRLATELVPGDGFALSRLAYSHLMQGDEAEAEKYANESLAFEPDESTALFVLQELEDRKRPLGERVAQFFEDYYLYRDHSVQWEKAFAGVRAQGTAVEKIAEAVNAAKEPDDRFTFALYGELYDRYTEATEDGFQHQVNDEMVYVRLDMFHEHTDDQFIELLDGLDNTAEKGLVLDLRGNGGGLTESANRMLDALLPDYVTSTYIYSDGYSDSYYSDADYVPFSSIYVLVDEGTASAAELLALSLRTYLPDTQLIGRSTFGKGVGQVVFEDREAKLLVFVVSFYWNVKQNNISSSGIKPDISVRGNKLADFMQAVGDK